MYCVFTHFGWPGNTLEALFVFLFTKLSQVFLYTCIMCNIIVVLAKDYAIAVNASAISQRLRKFIKGFLSSSLSLFWLELLAFSYRCPPQTNR